MSTNTINMYLFKKTYVAIIVKSISNEAFKMSLTMMHHPYQMPFHLVLNGRANQLHPPG